jgi:hypothetical protein
VPGPLSSSVLHPGNNPFTLPIRLQLKKFNAKDPSGQGYRK